MTKKKQTDCGAELADPPVCGRGGNDAVRMELGLDEPVVVADGAMADRT